MSRDELVARLITLECERDAYVNQINELRSMVTASRVFVVRQILDSISRGIKTSLEISSLTGIDRKSVQTRLSELARFGVLQPRICRSNGRSGRPVNSYEFA